MGHKQSKLNSNQSSEKKNQPKVENETNNNENHNDTTNKPISYPVVGTESIMKKKKHGTSETPVQKNLRWGCDFKTADRICNYNRHYAEHSGYFQKKKLFLKDAEKCKKANKTMLFYDSNTGKPLYEAPKGRGWDEFLRESRAHGWPSFRDPEVIWDDVRCLKNGEAVSMAGTHLGHNLPDGKGNRKYNQAALPIYVLLS
uniref:MsrB domain-containing protein n=1 Tax=Ditylum brightwellii TaxID=49249 RepID=A0A7S4QFW1_9STRA|mmetsp:Transcript_503/g.637  ORF Transcript_503/g.637 Transcript_503/m.637 type:complete len:200 (+) Transcript_503:143-742(+)